VNTNIQIIILLHIFIVKLITFNNVGYIFKKHICCIKKWSNFILFEILKLKYNNNSKGLLCYEYYYFLKNKF